MARTALARYGRYGAGGVTRTVWLASYPKSGNTWLRTLIANLASSDDKPVNINELPSVGMASDRHDFDYTQLIDSGLLTHDEIDNLRPSAFAALAGNTEESAASEAAPGVTFFKVHEAYMLNPAGKPVLGGPRVAHGAILVVRDPRDVAPSLANHSNKSIDDAIAILNDENYAWGKRTNRQDQQLRQKLCDWSAHTSSWLDQTDIPVHVVRYEDLRQDTHGTLRTAMEFAAFPATDDAFKRAAAFSSFTELRFQEQQNGFREAPKHGSKFFRRGEAGGWRDELTREQVARIESRHWATMLRLGYELSYASEVVHATCKKGGLRDRSKTG